MGRNAPGVDDGSPGGLDDRALVGRVLGLEPFLADNPGIGVVDMVEFFAQKEDTKSKEEVRFGLFYEVRSDTNEAVEHKGILVIPLSVVERYTFFGEEYVLVEEQYIFGRIYED